MLNFRNSWGRKIMKKVNRCLNERQNEGEINGLQKVSWWLGQALERYIRNEQALIFLY